MNIILTRSGCMPGVSSRLCSETHWPRSSCSGSVSWPPLHPYMAVAVAVPLPTFAFPSTLPLTTLALCWDTILPQVPGKWIMFPLPLMILKSSWKVSHPVFWMPHNPQGLTFLLSAVMWTVQSLLAAAQWPHGCFSISIKVIANIHIPHRAEKQIAWLPCMSIRVVENIYVTHQDLCVIKCSWYVSPFSLPCAGCLDSGILSNGTLPCFFNFVIYVILGILWWWSFDPTRLTSVADRLDSSQWESIGWQCVSRSGCGDRRLVRMRGN